MKHLLLLALLLVLGCEAAREIQPRNLLKVYGLHQSPAPFYWEREVSRRYPTGTVVVVCHGGIDPDVWMCVPDEGPARTVIGVVSEIRKSNPHARIVLCICNPHGHRLPANITNVTYPLNNIWQFPDRSTGLDFDKGFGTDYIGDIHEFLEQ